MNLNGKNWGISCECVEHLFKFADDSIILVFTIEAFDKLPGHFSDDS